MISLIFICSFISKTDAQTTPPEERAALMAIYNATDGPNWYRNTNWGTGDPCTNNWYGVTCNTSGNIIAISLHQNLMSGPIPPEIGNLPHLSSIVFSSNQLTGSIPSEIGNLSELTHINIYHNQLSGNIPPEIGNLNKLTYLDLYSNQLVGNIPDELYNLVKLEYCQLGRNQLIGIISPEVGSLTNLTYFSLTQNRLTGNIPSEIGNLSRLQHLFLNGNKLTGIIPNEIGNLTELVYLYLSFNSLTGNIPTEIGNLNKLAILSLLNNQLTGEIPSEIGQLISLNRLELENNRLTNSIPAEIGNLSNLQRLSAHNNQLSGNIPHQIGNISNLRWIYLSDNQLSGSLPPELGNLTGLYSLILRNNNLSGCFDRNLKSLCGLGIEISLEGNALPDFIAFCNDGTGECTVTPQSEIDALMAIYNATDGENWNNNTNWGVGDPFTNNWYGVSTNSDGNVTGLSFSQNNLNGHIPSEIKNLTQLTSFNSHYNYISSLPPEIGTLSNLTYLRIAYYGNNPGPVTIPDEIYNLTGLTFLGLEGVGLTDIPPEIGNLQNLEILQVYQNQLSELPDELFTLSKLNKLHLSWNRLTELPPGIGDLSNLGYLILNYNQLSLLPPEIGKLSKLYFLTVFKNNLTGLPDEFANLTNLQRFQADYNQIASLPSGLFDLPMLWELHLSHNYLTGNIPPELGAQTSLKSVYLNDNQLEGKIPPELAGLYKLTSLNLSNNNLSGCFDQALTVLCGKNVQLSGNPDLPDFNAFCTDGTSTCVPPVALCQDIVVSADNDCVANASIDNGSYDENGETLTFTQYPEGPYPIGETQVVLTVSDGKFESQCAALVTVVDNTPPIPDIAQLPVISGECSAIVETMPTATDNCAGLISATTTDPLEYFEQGEYFITWSYDDGCGNMLSQQQLVVVRDETPPMINTYPNPAITLDKVNHRYVTVFVTDLVSSVADNCALLSIGDVSIILVESDEEEDGDDGKDFSDGRTSDDIVIGDDCSYVELMDEMNIKGNGRVYTIYLSLDDGFGNNTIVTSEVHVVDKTTIAIKDETKYTVSSKYCGPQASARKSFDKNKDGYLPSNLSIINYPNPFSDFTNIEFSIEQSGPVLIELYTLNGIKLTTLVNEVKSTGIHKFTYHPKGIPDGLYLYRIHHNELTLTRKMILKR